MRHWKKPARRRSVGLIGLLALMLSAVAGVATATAAPPVTTAATITSAEFTQDTAATGSRAELALTWELPDNPEPPVGLLVELPPELQGRTDSFQLLDDDGVPMGHCTVTATQLACDFNQEYLAENPRDINGTAWFWVSVDTEVTEETDVTYDFDGVEGKITVTPPSSGSCTDNCHFNGRGSYKWGTYDEATDSVYWRVVVKAPTGGMVGGEEITVVDRVGPAQEVSDVRIRHTDQLVVDANGREAPGNYSVLDPSLYSVSEDLTTVTFTTEKSYFYVIDYTTGVTDGGASEEYTNEADITLQGETTRTVVGEVINQRGGGSGSGSNVGTFSITKEVLGAADAAARMTFTGTYEATTPAGDVLEGTFEVADGETWTSSELPRGASVHLTEITPAAPENVSWADPVFSENDFTVGSGSTTTVTLTNEATLLTGSFSVIKSVAGDGAALVDDDATFVVTYSYPAGSGFDAGSGELVVAADGIVSTSEQLPAGAVLTLTEDTPDPITGLTWTASAFSTTSVRIAADRVTAVELVNTATATPPPSDPPSDPLSGPPSTGSTDTMPPPDPTPPALAATGADEPTAAVIGALAMMVTGAILLRLRRRQRS